MNRRRVLILSTMVFAALVLGGVLVSRYEPKQKLMDCGHPKEFRFPLMSYAKSHCLGQDAIMTLQLLWAAQRSYQTMGGKYASTLKRLGELELFPPHLIKYGLTMTSDGTNWSACIPKQISFSGHYLVTSAGRLHFNSTRPATTNDYVLRDWSQ